MRRISCYPSSWKQLTYFDVDHITTSVGGIPIQVALLQRLHITFLHIFCRLWGLFLDKTLLDDAHSQINKNLVTDRCQSCGKELWPRPRRILKASISTPYHTSTSSSKRIYMYTFYTVRAIDNDCYNLHHNSSFSQSIIESTLYQYSRIKV